MAIFGRMDDDTQARARAFRESGGAREASSAGEAVAEAVAEEPESSA